MGISGPGSTPHVGLCGGVQEAMLKAFSDKVPKVVAAALEVLRVAVALFGTKVVPPQPILKALPAVYAASQAPIREAAKALTVRAGPPHVVT